MLLQTNVFEAARTLREHLLKNDTDVVRRWGTTAAEYSARLGRSPADLPYEYIPEFCRNVNQQVYLDLGQEGSGAFQRIVACHEVAALETRLRGWRLPLRILDLLQQAAEAILKQIQSGPVGYFSLTNELFVKDLAMCRLKLLPCGAEMVDTHAGFARSMLWGSTLRGGLRFGRALLQMRGRNFPTLVAHWDRRAIREFNSEGYRRFYKTVAELIELNPRYQGLCGESWWFDPQLAKISPELAFLREESFAGGAICIAVHTDEKTVARALSMSAARKSAFERGEYVPRSMFWLWPKRSLLRWAAGSSA